MYSSRGTRSVAPARLRAQPLGWRDFTLSFCPLTEPGPVVSPLLLACPHPSSPACPSILRVCLDPDGPAWSMPRRRTPLCPRRSAPGAWPRGSGHVGLVGHAPCDPLSARPGRDRHGRVAARSAVNIPPFALSSSRSLLPPLPSAFFLVFTMTACPCAFGRALAGGWFVQTTAGGTCSQELPYP